MVRCIRKKPTNSVGCHDAQRHGGCSLQILSPHNQEMNMIKRQWRCKLACIFFVCISLSLASCAKTTAVKPSGWIGYQQSGKASYYAMKYQNRKTASGERLNQEANTAAHRKLPFGTIVKVTNIKNGKRVTVRINDRGPFVKGRVIDLTRSAFSSIGDLNSGVIDVKIEVVQ